MIPFVATWLKMPCQILFSSVLILLLAKDALEFSANPGKGWNKTFFVISMYLSDMV